jgi:hypothetical protein
LSNVYVPSSGDSGTLIGAFFSLQPQHLIAPLTLSTSSGRRIEEFNVVGNLMEGRIRSLQRKGEEGC